ncbi:MAG: hypothetical protein WC812_02445 [Candidatus Pacearchaeota archaeon]|jgi:hypothetical protein
MKKYTVIIVIGIILLVLLVWGLIGSSEAAKIGIDCDIGIGQDGSVFCWKWHQNIIGDIGNTINEIFNK